MDMFAAIDLGSNSFRLHIGQYDGTSIHIIKSARNQVNLAAGLDANDYLTEEAMQIALACLSEFKELLAAFPIEAARVVATNTLRVAKNAEVFLPLAEQAIGYPIEVISGEEEGRLIYMGVANAEAFSGNSSALVVDIGGGSTEIILGRGTQINQVESFSIGTQPQRQAFFPEGVFTEQAFDAAVTSARACFEDAASQYATHDLKGIYGSSGTIRAIASVIAKNNIGDGALSYINLLHLKRQLIAVGHIDKLRFIGLKPERAVVLASGLSILLGIYQELCLGTMQTTVAGLRMGILWDLQLRAQHQDRRELAISGLMRKFHVDERRAHHAATVAQALYRQMSPTDTMLDKCVYWAGLLHEVGLCLSHSNVHKHSAYMVDNADLSGFTKREQHVMGTLVLGQKGNLKKIEKPLADLEMAKAVLAIRLATMCLHAKITDAASEILIDMHTSITVNLREAYLQAHDTLPYWLCKEQAHWQQVGVSLTVNTH
jgi:exopolyphosphatase/guanosine-5'-triphosphate,3'-diphosphate pyrophosphatase